MNLFPPLEKQAQIQFVIARRLPYSVRMKLVPCILAARLAIQIAGAFIVGWLVLAASMLLGMVQGYNATPDFDASDEKWNPVTPDEFRKIRHKQNDLQMWDPDFFDITNPLGFFGFVLALGCIVAGAIILPQDRLKLAWIADCAVLVLPHWFIGVRRYLKQPRLIIKAGMLESILQQLSTPSDLQAQPLLATRQTVSGRLAPVDARIMMRLLGAPPWFIGVQIQICINTVQGSDYPYLYCVILGKREGEMLERFKALQRTSGSNIVIETSFQDNTDIVVVRQAAGKNSGYHTKPADARRLVECAVDISRRLCRTQPAL